MRPPPATHLSTKLVSQLVSVGELLAQDQSPVYRSRHAFSAKPAAFCQRARVRSVRLAQYLPFWGDFLWGLHVSGHTRFRLVCLSLLVVITASLVQVVAGGSIATAESQADAQSEDDFTRADSVSAAMAARLLDHRVEDLSQRTETTVVYANPNGSWTSDEASEPVRVETTPGDWHDIDTTLVESDGKLSPAYALTDLSLSDGGERTFASMTEEGHDLSWQWPTTLPEPSVDGDTATYANVIDGGDLVVTATSTGFTHSVVLRERPAAPVEFTMPVGLDGAQLTESPNTGILIVKEANGAVVAAAPRPMMWDSTDGAGGVPENAVPVDAAVTKTSTGGTRLTLSPDEGFLSDPNTVFPVTVDPGYSVYTTGDTWIMNADFTGSQSTSQELRAGTYDAGGHIARSLIKFDTSYLTGRDVTAATLRLRNWDSASCTAGALRAYEVTSNWALTGVTWANQPAVSATNYSDYSPAHGFSSGCGEDNAYWDVKSIIRAWTTGGHTNYGIRVRGASETSSATWRKYRSADYTANPVYAPRLITDYNNYPDVPDAQSLAVSPVRGSSTNSAIPTLSALISDPDYEQVLGGFHLYDSTGVEIWAQHSNPVASGAVSYVTVPTGLLRAGETYSFKVRSSETVESPRYSDLSAAKPFTFDPFASVVPAPACTGDCVNLPEPVVLHDGTLAAGQHVTLPVVIPGTGDSGELDLVDLRLTARSWGNAGSVTISNPDTSSGEPPTLGFSSSDDPMAGATVTARTLPSDENALELRNNGTSSVSVRVEAIAWTTWLSSNETEMESVEAQPTEEDLAADPSLTAVDVAQSEPIVASVTAQRTVVGASPMHEPVEESIPCPDDPNLDCIISIAEGDPAEAETEEDPDTPTYARVGAAQSATAVSSTESKCLAKPDTKGWVYSDRFHACRAHYFIVTVYRATPPMVVRGRAGIKIHVLVGADRRAGRIYAKARATYVKVTGTGSAAFLTTSGQFAAGLMCEGCTYSQTARLPGPWISAANRSTGWVWGIDSAFPVPYNEVNPGFADFKYWNNTPGGMELTNGIKISGPFIKCDKLSYLPGTGCVMHHYVPTYRQSMSGLGGQTATHMYWAQLFLPLHPGAASNGLALHRYYWAGKPNLNRRAALRMCRAEGVANSCDEYPFASTDLGCKFAPNCSLAGVSVADNREQGRQVGMFYGQQRIKHGDPFWTAGTP